MDKVIHLQDGQTVVDPHPEYFCAADSGVVTLTPHTVDGDFGPFVLRIAEMSRTAEDAKNNRRLGIGSFCDN